jgi:lysozyme
MKNDKSLLFLAWLIVFAFSSCGNSIRKWNGGLYHGETDDGKPSGYGVWKQLKSHSEYAGFWSDGRKNGKGILTVGRQKYAGDFRNDQYTGYGTLSFADSVEYRGFWKNGRREGHGEITDSCARVIKGIWHNDTLRYGTRKDSDGVYTGQMDAKGSAEGHGTYLSAKGDYYEGFWKNDRREGFGYSVSDRRQMRAGEWKRDHYYGERIMYTSERIYGIDISKYQHEIGRKRFGISWSALRIRHLGTISKKKVNGNVNFPISFIYIKSTQGIKIFNRYYRADYLQAHRHGFHVGTYHFFSTVTPPARQANHFLRHSCFRRGDFPPVLDVEPLPSQVAKMGGRTVLLNRILEWMRIVGHRVGVRPILYVSQTFVNRYLNNAPTIKNNYMIWIARYGEYKPDVNLIYWQLCPDGRVSGIHGAVDINVFNGYRDQFDTFLSSKRVR